MARILITGGCGFIGSHLTIHHLSLGDEVILIDDLSSGSLENIKTVMHSPNLQIVQADLLTWTGLEETVKKVDRIYHMAAIVGVFKVLSEPVKVITTNINGCIRILEAATQTKSKARILLASSSSVYGAVQKPLLSEEDDLVVKMHGYSLSTYMISKISQEAIALAYFKEHRLPLTLLRLFNVIGPRQTGLYGMVVPRFVKQACAGEPITVYGDGTQTRSFCDVRDAVNAMMLIAECEQSVGEFINIGNTQELTISDLAKLVKTRANSQSVIRYMSYEEAYGAGFKDTTQRKPDLSKIMELTSYRPQWQLEQTIDELISLVPSKKT